MIYEDCVGLNPRETREEKGSSMCQGPEVRGDLDGKDLQAGGGEG